MTSPLSDTKKSLDTYIEDNNKAINNKQTKVKAAVSDIEKLKKDVQNLKEDLTKAKQDLDRTRNKIDIASKELNEKTATIVKLDFKYVKDEEIKKCCMLIIDGIKEVNPKLEIEYRDSDIKNAFRSGPLRKGVSRPGAIKVELITPTPKETSLEIKRNSAHSITGRVSSYRIHCHQMNNVNRKTFIVYTPQRKLEEWMSNSEGNI